MCAVPYANFSARMAAQSSTEDVLMESAGTPTELPSPTPLAAEAWPATAAAAAGMAGGAATGGTAAATATGGTGGPGGTE